MNADHLLKRRAEIVQRHELLESVPGSGYHPDDPQAAAVQKAGALPLSKRPVVLHHDGAHYLCGDDVPAVRGALAAFAAAFAAEQKTTTEAHAVLGLGAPDAPAIRRQAAAVASRLADGDGAVIELRPDEWNACAYALTEMKVRVVSAGVVG